MNKLTVALATYNEESNIKDCLESVMGLADEIVIVDGNSTDKTVGIAREFGARIELTDNPKIFHINKQKALDMSVNNWVLQLDADERVTKDLAHEIKKIIQLSDKEIDDYEANMGGAKLFRRHQKLIEERDGQIGKKDGRYVAFFIPRLNYFLGKYLRHGGVYPDGVIRLVDRRYAHLPCVDVHEQFVIDGRVGWLKNPLFHIDSPTFSRYWQRNNRYTALIGDQIKNEKKNLLTPLRYLIFFPLRWFLLTSFRHKGILDGWRGILFAFFSSLRFPIGYMKYLKSFFSNTVLK